MKTYLKNVLMGLDVFVNAITGGSWKQTISARAGLIAKARNAAHWLCRLIGWLFRDPDHCAKAAERARKKTGK